MRGAHHHELESSMRPTLSRLIGSVAPGWSDADGHDGVGVLDVSSSGYKTGAASGAFAAVPGARYTLRAWTKAAGTAHLVAVGLRFYDKNGAVLAAASQLGEARMNSASNWTHTPAVVGFAPANAVTGDLRVVSMDPTTDAVSSYEDYVDDVTLDKITGLAAPIQGPLHSDSR